MALKGKSGGGKIDQHFDKTYGGDTAQNYQNYFVPVIGKPIAKDLIKIADIHPGENVLDVACGTGVAAFLAKEKAGNGLVAGVDINPGMLQEVYLQYIGLKNLSAQVNEVFYFQT